MNHHPCQKISIKAVVSKKPTWFLSETRYESELDPYHGERESVPFMCTSSRGMLPSDVWALLHPKVDLGAPGGRASSPKGSMPRSKKEQTE